MADILLDTNAISDLMRDQPQVTAHLSNHNGLIGTSVVVVGEIHYGLILLPLGKKRSALEVRVQSILEVLSIHMVTARIAETYGTLKAALEAKGARLDDNDLWIAATAVTNGLVRLTTALPMHR